MESARWKHTLGAVGVFAMAMGFLEAAVVVYLRREFYPQGFAFPLSAMPQDVVHTEIAREAATIVMLGAVGWIAGRSTLGRLAFFAFAFAVWDLFYYIFLKIAVDWPASLLTDDILFLIPVPWIGPVLAPVIVSIVLIGGSILVLRREAHGRPVIIRPLRWLFICLGGLLIVASFLLDTGAALHQQLPGPFHWPIFSAGILVGMSSFVSALEP
jgi:hypothetical protein